MVTNSLTFVCWKWAPNPFHQSKKESRFSSHHVNILYAMLQCHVKLPFKLICATDDPEGIDSAVEIVPLWDDYRSMGGCFTRLVTFKDDFRLFGDRFISIDLDCVILKDITDLFRRRDDFVIWKLVKGVGSAYYCGSLWMLTAGTRSIVYDSFHPENFVRNTKDRYPGGTDQKHITNTLYPTQAVWDRRHGIYNFVTDIRNSGGVLPLNAKIIFFNGKFMPEDLMTSEKYPWIAPCYSLTPKPLPRSKPIPKVKIPTVSFVLYWWGAWPTGNAALGLKYISNLVLGIEKHIPDAYSYQIILFTDKPGLQLEGVDVRKLDTPPLRWNLRKMFMYSKEANLQTPVLCFDLDCIVVSDLSPLIDKVAGLTRDLIITCAGAYKKKRMGGSIVGFIPNSELTKRLWEPLLSYKRNRIERVTKGSERFYYRVQLKKSEVAFWEDQLPDKVLSYKRDCSSELPEKAAVVRFHGAPRPHEVDVEWVKRFWK